MSADSATAVPTIGTPLPLYDERPLPAGWLKRVNERTNCPFYVDTLGRPPHSIWVHPLDDPDYLRKTGQIYPDEEKGPPPPAYPVDEKIRRSRPSDEDDLNADSSEQPSPVEPTEAGTPPSAAAGEGPSAAKPNPYPSSPSASESGPSNSQGKKATIFSKLKGKSNSKVNPTLAERETKRESEAKAYYIQREVMLAKRKEESSSDADFARILTRPYVAPLPSDYGGPRYKPPVHKSFGEKLSGVADGAFNLLFGSSWPERYGDERGSWK